MKDNAAPEPVKVGAVDIEVFANNLARMVEEGGKALAAYMKPREEGQVQAGLSDEMNDMVKTLGEVGSYWLSDPSRAVELQSQLGRAYLNLWGAAAKRLSGEETGPVVTPDPKDRRFADRHRLLRFRHLAFGPIQTAVFDKNHGVVIADC
jgi:polyhydroxyalkanoate synthase